MNIFVKVYKILPDYYKKRLPLLLLMIMGGTLLEALGLGAVLPAIAILSGQYINLIKDYFPLLDGLSQNGLIMLVFVGLVGLYIFKSIYMLYLTWIQNDFAFGLQADLSKKIYVYYINKEYMFHLNNNSSELISHINGEVNTFTYQVVLPLTQVVTEITILIGLVVLLFNVQPISSIFIILFFFLLSVMYYKFFSNRLFNLGLSKQLHEAEKFKKVIQGLSGIREVKLHNVSDSFVKVFDKHNTASIYAGKIQQTINMVPRILLELMAVFGVVILVFIMIYVEKKNPSGIVPSIAIFAAAAFRITPSINKLIISFQSIRYGTSSIEVLKKFNFRNIKSNQSRKFIPISFQRDIHLKNISFKYPTRNDYVFKNLTLRIKRGESVGIFGPSGAGKSTLLDIILGLVKPNTGLLLIDKKDIWSLHQNSSWQDCIGYVPQSIYLLDDSIIANVAFGIEAEKINYDLIIECLKKVDLYDFITTLPKGIFNYVGERGAQLSGGQKQRLGIARALYNKPTVLILDEATSALDSNTEKNIMRTISGMHGKLTIIAVAHRLSTLDFCDYKIKISDKTASVLKK